MQLVHLKIIHINSVIKKYLDIVDEIIKDYLLIDLDSDRDFIESYIDSLSHYPDEIKKNIRDKYIQDALFFIRNEIEKCIQIRKDSPEQAYESGSNLYFNTNEFLIFLKHKYDFSDVRYQTIADKLAEEILQCSVDYFIDIMILMIISTLVKNPLNLVNTRIQLPLVKD